MTRQFLELIEAFLRIGKKIQSGFQSVSEAKGNFILLFRELPSTESSRNIHLKFPAGKKIKITNLQTGNVEEKKVDLNGNLNFTIQKPADILFLKYEVLGR